MSRFNFTFILIKKNEHITRIIIKFFKYFQRTSLSTYQSFFDENFDKPRVEIYGEA